MKSTVAAAGAIVLALAATTASAGVVITQEVTESNQPAGHKTEQTVMIQGHKQKLVVGEREYITDLDAGKMYYVLAQKKAYMELPFPPISGPERMIARPELVVGLKKTARMDKVAGYDCQDYTNVVPAAQSSLRLTQCVASGAPGAKEFADYQKALADKIKSMAPEGDPIDGIPVLSISARFVNKIKLSAKMPPDIAAKMEAAMDKIKPFVVTTTVTNIEVKDLPADTFVVPKGYVESQVPAVGLPGKVITSGKAPAGQASAAMPAIPAAPAVPATH
ncbi:MAG: hypothetical protein WCD12_07165 [Candidatus Binatus sp.]|jgi:hypothetical protein|uniref:hypothetical protein n=1 Tax=Candidatus Binatus sp. TaxID=2811406 RepID=UPI003C7382B6